MLGGGARRRSGGVDAATVPLLDDDSGPSNVSGNLALHVLVAPDFDGLCGQEPGDTAGENVIVTETRVRIPLGATTGNEPAKQRAPTARLRRLEVAF